MTDNEIRRLWVQMGSYWRQFSVPEDNGARMAMLEDWRPFLADVDPDGARVAVMGLAVSAWPPPPGEVRQRALLAASDDGPPDLDVAWREVQLQIRSVGMSGTVVWSHPAIGETVASVGWRNLCMADEGDPAIFRQWREFYGLAAARHRAALAPSPTAVRALDGAGWPRAVGSGETV